MADTLPLKEKLPVLYLYLKMVCWSPTSTFLVDFKAFLTTNNALELSYWTEKWITTQVWVQRIEAASFSPTILQQLRSTLNDKASYYYPGENFQRFFHYWQGKIQTHFGGIKYFSGSSSSLSLQPYVLPFLLLEAQNKY